MTRRCVQCNAPLDQNGFLCVACAVRQGLPQPALSSASPTSETSASEAFSAAPQQTMPQEPRAGCVHCDAPFVEADYPTPLCTACRDMLSRRPVPVGIRVAAAAIAVIVLLSFVRFPAAVKAGVAYARGQEAEAAGDNDRAATQYLITAKQYPHSTLALARLGLTCYKAGDYDDAEAAFDELGGRKTDPALADEVNAAITDMDAKADAADKAALKKTKDTAPVVLQPQSTAPVTLQPPTPGPMASSFQPGNPRPQTRFSPHPFVPPAVPSPNAPPPTGETGSGAPSSDPMPPGQPSAPQIGPTMPPTPQAGPPVPPVPQDNPSLPPTTSSP